MSEDHSPAEIHYHGAAAGRHETPASTDHRTRGLVDALDGLRRYVEFCADSDRVPDSAHAHMTRARVAIARAAAAEPAPPAPFWAKVPATDLLSLLVNFPLSAMGRGAAREYLHRNSHNRNAVFQTMAQLVIDAGAAEQAEVGERAADSASPSVDVPRRDLYELLAAHDAVARALRELARAARVDMRAAVDEQAREELRRALYAADAALASA